MAGRVFGDATTLDGRVGGSGFVDPHHPLHGKCFPVCDRRSGRGSGLIVIRLPDGRERAVPRSATAVASASDDRAAPASREAHISVRTLLPLANHVRAVLAFRNADLEASSARGPRSAPCRAGRSRRSGRHACGRSFRSRRSANLPSGWDSSCSVCELGPSDQRRVIVLSTMLSSDERITTTHRAKLAYVYVRQSSPGQVRFTRKALSCSIAWSSEQFCSVGHANGFTLSTTISANPERPAEIGRAFRC